MFSSTSSFTQPERWAEWAPIPRSGRQEGGRDARWSRRHCDATRSDGQSRSGRRKRKRPARSCSAGAASLPPPNHNRFLERHPHVRNALKLLARKVELQTRKTHEIGRRIRTFLRLSFCAL